MKLLRLETRHWRGLTHTLDDLHEGLNLVVGPNEAGKSRLFQALHFGLFESSKGKPQYKKDLASWDSADKPAVTVAFEREGQRYEVEKTFLTTGYSTVLRRVGQGAGQTWKDEEAEAELRSLLDTRDGGGRSQSSEDYGLWPLLWVSQESSLRAPQEDFHEQPRQRLEDLLQQEAGEIAAGPRGEAVLDAAKREAGKYWTSTYRATNELKAVEAAYAAARQTYAEAVEKRQRVHRQSRELARQEESLERAEAALDPLRQRLEAARESHRRLEDLQAREAMQARAAVDATTRWDSARGQLRERQELEGQVAAADKDLATASAELASASARLDELRRQLERAEAAAVAAEAAEERAQRAATAARRAATVGRLEEELASLTQRQQRVDALRQRLEELTRALAPLPTEAEVATLRRRSAALREAEAGLEAAGAHLRVTALRGLELRQLPGDGAPPAALDSAVLDSAALEAAPQESISLGSDATWELSITEPHTLELPGVARLHLAPGGDLSELQQRRRAARRALDEALEQAGATNLDAAEEANARRRALEHEQSADQRRHDDLLADGPDLGQQRAELEGRLDAERQTLAAVSPADTLDLPETSAAPEGAEAAEGYESTVSEARQAVTARRAERDALRAPREQAVQRQSTLQRRVDQFTDGLQRDRQRLDQLPAAEDLQRQVDEAHTLLRKAQDDHQGLSEELETLRREVGEHALEQAQQAVRQKESEHAQLLSDVHSLKAEIRVQADDETGLHAAVQQSEGALTHAWATLRRVSRRAAAARTLLQTLEAQRTAARQRLAAPVRAAIEPYLQRIFPGSTLALDDAWNVQGLHTGATPESLPALSGGAREQLGLLVRLGLATVFARESRLPVVLDDSLVHTDRHRLEVFHSILYDMARTKNLQILLFTCHGDAYNELGADRVVRLPGDARVHR